MEPEDWVHVRVMTKVSNDIAMVVEKKVVIPDTPQKKQDGNGKSLLLVAKGSVYPLIWYRYVHMTWLGFTSLRRK